MRREKVTFQRQVRTTDANGEPTTEWVTFYQPAAVKLTEVSPSLDIIAQQENVSMFVNINMRYNPEIEIKLGDRILWREFTLHSIRTKTDRVKRKVEILCTSEIETSDREAPEIISTFDFTFDSTFL